MACATETCRSEWMSAPSLLNTGLFWTWTQNREKSHIEQKHEKISYVKQPNTVHNYSSSDRNLHLLEGSFFSGMVLSIPTRNVMKISFFPTGILTVWPSSTPWSKTNTNQSEAYIIVVTVKPSPPIGLNVAVAINREEKKYSQTRTSSKRIATDLRALEPSQSFSAWSVPSHGRSDRGWKWSSLCRHSDGMWSASQTGPCSRSPTGGDETRVQ